MKRWWRDFSPFLPIFTSRIPAMAIGSFLGLLAILSAMGLLSLSGWFLSATAYAGLTAATAKEFNFFLPAIGVRILAMSRTLARYGERLASHDATFKILESLRAWFYIRLEPLAPARLMAFGSGDILNRIVADIDALDNLYLRVLSPLLVAGAATLALLLFLARIDPALALAAIMPLLTAGWGIPLWAAKKGAQIGEKLAAMQSRLRGHMVEGVQGMAELLVFDLTGRYFDRVMTAHDQIVAYQRRMAHLAGITAALMTLLFGAAVLGILFSGCLLVARHAMGGETLTLVTLAVMAAFEALWPLPTAFQYLGHTRASALRLNEIIAVRPEVEFPPQTLQPPRGSDLVVDHLAFRYSRNAPWILKDFSLSIPAGSRMALIGPSGAGKSTLAHLLVRFYDPIEGAIRLGGRDIRQMSESDLRRCVVLISQKAHIFNATIRSNLLLADAGASKEKLWQALTAARLDAFVKELPDGLDTYVGEGGKRISGGQAQRLALARAFLRNAPIWVLDEPTEGLDPETEAALLDTLLPAGNDRTLIAVTHRKAVMERFERVVWLEIPKQT